MAVGKGPIETIATRQLRGEIGSEEALRQVQLASFVRGLDPTYAQQLVPYAKSIAQNGRLTEVVLYVQLLAAAAEAGRAASS